MKSIHTLVQDIYEVIDNGGGWDQTVSSFLAGNIQSILDRRLLPTEEQPESTLRMSQLGTPCKRKLWYSINSPSSRAPLEPQTKLKFLYGDILEELLLSLAVAAGHKVEGLQDELEIGGVKGHRDAVIDGITIDVKSASHFAFKKFKEGRLRSDDPFGYISQLSSYVYAGRLHEVESHPSLGGFLVIDKQSGELCLDIYDLNFECKTKEAEVAELKTLVVQSTPVERAFSDQEDGKSGNRKLCTQCSYCDYKKECWPSARGFAYSNGPRFLTQVAKVPNVPEFKVE